MPANNFAGFWKNKSKGVIYIFSLLLCCPWVNKAAAQKSKEQQLHQQIDALIDKANTSFNGVVYIVQEQKVLYAKAFGYADITKKIPLKRESPFLIGSISKQVTAVLVLQEVEKGRIDLRAKISKYLPGLKETWKDSVTVHQLLAHTHGITEDGSNKLLFSPGKQFQYSQIGFRLLSAILEKVNGKTFEQQVTALFKRCGMTHAAYPTLLAESKAVKGHIQEANGTIRKIEPAKSLEKIPVAAGGFIATADDVLLWNRMLHGGKLLSPKYYDLMMTPQPNAIRIHPVFGRILYGYGITVDKGSPLQYGQTGYAPGYPAMDYYFPQEKTTIIVLSNKAADEKDLKKTFAMHTLLLDKVREYVKKQLVPGTSKAR